MTTETQNDPSGGEPDDTGEPIAVLRDLSLEVDARFGRRVRGGIERRVLTGDIVELAWTAPTTIVLEFLQACLELLAGRKRT